MASSSPRRPVGRRQQQGAVREFPRTDGGSALPATNPTHCQVGYWQSGVYVEHVATGLFLYGAYGQEFLDNVDPGFNHGPDHWMVKAGIRQHWNPLGHTVLYGSFDQRTDMVDSSSYDDDTDRAGC